MEPENVVGCRLHSDMRPGFSLVELLVTMGIVVLLASSGYAFFRSSLFALRTQETRIDLKENADIGLDFIARELRMAGARPVSEHYGSITCAAPAPAVAPVGCATTPGFASIVSASGQSISFQYDFRGDSEGSAPDGCPDDPDESIAYGYETSTQRIVRTANGQTHPVVGNVAVADFRFRYFRRDGSEMQAGGGALTAAERDAIASIVIVVAARAPDPHPARKPGSVLRSIQSSTIFVRNPLC